MTKPESISLVLPAYNEAKTIASTIHQSAQYFEQRGFKYEIIVAADGDDGTRENARALASRYPLLVMGESERRGKGRGVREGVAAASHDFIGFADADNKVPIEEFDKFYPLLQEGFEVVSGSRALDKSQIVRAQPLYRQLGGRGFRIVMRAVTGLPVTVTDSQCGFKFFPNRAAKTLFQLQQIDGYMFDVEILALAYRLRYRMKEVAVRWRDDGDSRLDLIAGNLRNMRDIFRIRELHRHVSAEQYPSQAALHRSLPRQNS